MANLFHPLVSSTDTLDTGQLWAVDECRDTSAWCTAPHCKGVFLPATTITKSIHVTKVHSSTLLQDNRTTKHNTECMQVSSPSSPCHERKLQSTANLSCSWALFPCLLSKRPPSRCGKVASNLVSLLYLWSAVLRSKPLAHCGWSSWSSTRNLSLRQTHWTS